MSVDLQNTVRPESHTKERLTELRRNCPIFKIGINQIHLMPVYEFDENQRHVNYWGYGKAYFFAPKASYAAGDPVNEMKSLVRQMHLAGIEVILEMPFTEGTTFSLILDCLRYWVMQYHVDGFIVNPYICNPDELAKDPVLAKSKILKRRRIPECDAPFLKGR